MNSSEKKKDNPGLLRTMSSLQFGIMVLITIAVVAIVGTLLPQGRPIDFYREKYNVLLFNAISILRFDRTYSSPLFIGLLGLFGLNITLCSLIKFPRLFARTFGSVTAPSATMLRSMPFNFTVKASSLDDVGAAFGAAGFPLRPVDDDTLFGQKGAVGKLGASVVHLSLLVMLVGGTVSLMTGVRGQIVLSKGQSVQVATLPDGEVIDLGFSIGLDNFDVAFYESHPGRPRSFTSSVTVTGEDGNSFKRDIQVNHPLMLNGFNIYQSSYGFDETPAAVSSEHDSARVSVGLKGAPESMPSIAEFVMGLGDVRPVPGFGDSISIRLAELYRDFKLGGGGSMESSNPAVRFDVIVDGETRWSVYAFKNFPGMNMPMVDELDVSFAMHDIMVDMDTAVRETGSEYFTVLGVVRDKGVRVMWIGALLMMTGMFLSFYIKPKRVWARREEGKIIVAGRVKGDAESFRTYLKKTISSLRGATQDAEK